MPRLLFVLLLLCPYTAAALELEVRVSGNRESAVDDLRSEDFAVRERGQPRAVESARYVNDLGETKIYFAVEAVATTFPRVTEAVERFIEERLPEDVEVLFGGTPFTSDKEVLLQYLSQGPN